MTGDALAQFADRIGLNLAALLTIGFALHVAFGVVERDAFSRLRLPALLAMVALIAFALVRLLLLVGQMGDGANLIDPELMPLAWMALGPSTMLLIVGALAAGAGLLWRSRRLAWLGALAMAASFGFTGHTQGVEKPGLLPALAAIHVLIAGFWFAAPVTLFPHTHLSDSVLLNRLKRFSAIAVFAIPLLIVLGLWLALSLTGGANQLLGSAYGRLLLLKLAAGLAALGLGALNKRVIAARVAAEPVQGRRWLRTALLAEAMFFIVAIVAVSAATTIAGPTE